MALSLNNVTEMQNMRVYNNSAFEKAKSLEKLTTGNQVNSAADNPADSGIIDRYKTDIISKQQYINNVQDGISFIQTGADAINSMTDYMQRLKALSVRAANSTLTNSDRENIQQEVNQILEEINRYSEDVKFNGTKLLKEEIENGVSFKGSSIIGVVPSSVSAASIIALEEGDYNLTTSLELQSISTPALRTATTINISPTVIGAPFNFYTIDSNGTGQSFIATDNDIQSITFKMKNYSTGNLTLKIYDSLHNEVGSVTKSVTAGSDWTDVEFSFASPVSTTVGNTYYAMLCGYSDTNFEVQYNDPAFNPNPYSGGEVYKSDFSTPIFGGGYDHKIDITMSIKSSVPDVSWTNAPTIDASNREEGAKITLTNTGGNNWSVVENLDSGGTASTTYTGGNAFNWHGIEFNLATNPYYQAGDKISFDIYQMASFNNGEKQRVLPNQTYILSDSAGNKINVTFGNKISDGTDQVEVLGLPFETVKVKSDDGNELDTGLPDALNTTELNITDLNVSTELSARNAISLIDNAIGILSSKLAQLGGVQNRFQNTIALQNNTALNFRRAFSNINDTNYAVETSNFYQKNILTQSSITLSRTTAFNSNLISRLFKNMFG